MENESESLFRSHIASALASCGVPPELVALAKAAIPSDVRGLVLYGSRARGDHLADSDLDLLGLVDVPRRSVHRGLISLSFYTTDQLASGVGSLFGAHLVRDSRILWDPDGRVQPILDSMGTVDFPRLIRRSTFYSRIFGSLERDLPKYLPGLLREARYLLRSCLYGQAIAEDRPCFSIRELAQRHGDPSLANLLASRSMGEATELDLRECLFRLARIIGELPANPHGSLEALIVNEWGRDEELVSMALLALGGSNSDSDYTEVKKVLL